MKKKVFILGCLILGVESVYRRSKTKSPVDEFLLMNVEALATPEYTDERDICRGTGDTDCPNGVKVEIYTPNFYSLRK